jgi:ATP-binding cassette subfamily B protein/subfamily B ATP-binding cassette protein MsbA
MNNFARALRDALSYWKSLILATVLSLGVAALWGGNIGALFPVIEVTVAGESLQKWIQREITESEKAVEDLAGEIATLEAKVANADTAERSQLSRSIAGLKRRREAEQNSAASSRKLQPYINRFFPDDPFITVVLVIAVLMFSTLIKHVFLLGNTMIVARVSNNIARNIRLRVFKQAMEMDRAGFSENGSSGFTTQITHNTDMLCQGIMNVFGGAVREPMKILACLIGACIISWRLLLISMIVAPVVVMLIVWLSKRIKSVCRRTVQKARGFQHVMLEALGSVQTVQAYHMEETEQRRFASITGDVLRLAMKKEFYNALTRPVTELLGIGMVGTTVVVGAYLVLYQQTHIFGIPITDTPLSISKMLVFFGLLVGASDPVRKLSNVFSGINSGMVAAETIYPLLDRQSLITSPSDPRPVGKPHQVLELSNLSFAYRGDEYVLRDIDLRIPFGAKVALVGANGSGKSSLIHLICRFYDPQHGVVMLDGVDLRDMSLTDLRSRIGLVTQRTELFNESVLYNIRYGSTDATEEQVTQAAKMAHAHEFINDLPDQYNTCVGQGGQRLSGGQRQRIALARAILRDPEILILDEATSQIDTDSEQLINEVLTEFSANRTMIMITHRLSNLHLADMVFELSDGHLLEYDHRHQDVA